MLKTAPSPRRGSFGIAKFLKNMYNTELVLVKEQVQGGEEDVDYSGVC
jgi:hypothetical protein